MLACLSSCDSSAAGGDGSLMFWLVGQSEALAKVESAHANTIFDLAFHPMGHMMATCKDTDENGYLAGFSGLRVQASDSDSVAGPLACDAM